MRKPTIQNVQDFLSNHFKDNVANVSEVGTGEWSFAYFFHRADKNYVIRFSDYVDDFKKDQFAHYFSSTELPIPKILEIGQALGGSFAISKKVVGKPIDGCTTDEMRQIVPRVIDMLEELRAVDTSNTSGYGGWDENSNGTMKSWHKSLLNVTNDDPKNRGHGWKAKLASSETGSVVFDKVYIELSKLITYCPEIRHVIHSDLLHFNVLVDHDQITAVIDWGCAKYGDFLYDVAWFTFWSFWYPSMNGIDFKKEVIHHYQQIGLEVPNFEERIKCYELHIGLDSIVYSAYKENWEFIKAVENQLELRL